MRTWEIVVLIVVAIVLLLFAGGLLGAARRRAARAGTVHAALEEANRALAAARAEDRGWDPDVLEAAARAAHARRDGTELREVHLVQVVDRPGTEDDQARFRLVDHEGREHDVLLGRRGDDWTEL